MFNRNLNACVGHVCINCELQDKESAGYQQLQYYKHFCREVTGPGSSRIITGRYIHYYDIKIKYIIPTCKRWKGTNNKYCSENLKIIIFLCKWNIRIKKQSYLYILSFVSFGKHRLRKTLLNVPGALDTTYLNVKTAKVKTYAELFPHFMWDSSFKTTLLQHKNTGTVTKVTLSVHLF